MEAHHSPSTIQPRPLVCPHCGGTDLAHDPERPREYVCAHCRTRARLLPSRGALLLLGWVCPECGHDNERGNRFCTQCGTPLTKPCPNCGATMRAEDRFCNTCGKSRGQLVAEWYRTGKAALDAGRPWEAIPPLQRLVHLDPAYGDASRLLERAARESITRPPPMPVVAPSPAALAVREAVASLKREKRRGRGAARLLVLLTGGLVVLAVIASIAGLLLHSAAFGVLFFLFLCAIIGVNLWITLNHL